ncbi:hypothetical protein [Streptomyces sp. NBC_01276]|uniref:hypothetical protein n=1 Tax=Streptomyces sp. NBC_01276 TaxID=2903808 RepID=UPI00352FD78C
MSDFVDRVLGLPDPSAVRPRIPSFLDLPPLLDPPPPGADSEEEAAGARPPSDAPTTACARAAGTAPGPAVPPEPVRAPAPYAPAAPVTGARVRGDALRPGHGVPTGREEAAPRASAAGPGRPSDASEGAAPRPDGPDLPAAAGTPVAGRPGRTVTPAAQPRAAAGPRSVPVPVPGYGHGYGEARAGRRREPDGAAAGPEAGETTVHITIGRLEVRSGPRSSAAEPAPSVRRPPREPAVPLEDYLRRRSGGGR